MQKLNERTWAGHIIAWIKEAINDGRTAFQEATNDQGIKLDSGVTKFPDVLLFSDKVSGIVFNGWELKFPDTAADDRNLLLNALEKAEKLKSNSFVTWNGTQAIIWKIEDQSYSIGHLKKIKVYPAESSITSRRDLANPENNRQHEPALKNRLNRILHDLEQLHQRSEIREAINISSNIVRAVGEAKEYIVPQLEELINECKGESETFHQSFGKWKILESATLKILSSSSRRVERIIPEQVLAKFTFYKLIGKILFYLTLSENLSGKVEKLQLKDNKNVQQQLEYFFNQAKSIDYQAVFEPDFTDEIKYNQSIESVLFNLLQSLNEFDFQILPTEVIGNILENLVPKTEKQKFGQYFTPERLANLVAFSAIKGRSYTAIDPTCGTGTFLTSFYGILRHYGNKNHQQLLNQIWGNEISRFPAVLSVVNLYKQDLKDKSNFPRVVPRNYFSLIPHEKLRFPDPVNINKMKEVELPSFDAIASNFPFIQQEDVPNKFLYDKFRQEFQATQRAFVQDADFKLNERSDYYVYCFYNSLKFLKDGGRLAAITSNAWLGKNYGWQFKQFLLDNFSIKYVVRSSAEHWFRDSQVSTIYVTLKKTKEIKPTKFVTLNFKLNEFFREDDKQNHLRQIEDLYNEIDFCDDTINSNWKPDANFAGVYHKQDRSVTVSVVERKQLLQSLESKHNWAINFIAPNPLGLFENSLINPFPTIFDVGRGMRTGWDAMHILSSNDVAQHKIESKFLLPVLKTSQDLSGISLDQAPCSYLFVCDEPEEELARHYPHAYAWVRRWESGTNKKGLSLPQVFAERRPFWYSLRPEQPANIFISINPHKRLFFAFSKRPIYLNQRLTAIRTRPKEAKLVAALLNSIVGLLMVELNGVSRNLGALDLNADFFKTKMRMLNPTRLSEGGKRKILENFEPLCNRAIKEYNQELALTERREFDRTVLREFGYSADLVAQLYEVLRDSVRNRVEMKDR